MKQEPSLSCLYAMYPKDSREEGSGEVRWEMEGVCVWCKRPWERAGPGGTSQEWWVGSSRSPPCANWGLIPSTVE